MMHLDCKVPDVSKIDRSEELRVVLRDVSAISIGMEWRRTAGLKIIGGWNVTSTSERKC